METLHALEDLAQVLHRQVISYGQGRRLYDDTRQVDPAARVADALTGLDGLTAHVQAAQSPANRFFSAIGHIGIELPDPEQPDPDPSSSWPCDTGPCSGSGREVHQ